VSTVATHGRDLIVETVDEATGRRRRVNPVLAGTGGPAGNALLTAWTGLVLLALSVAELLTLFDVRGLISWHVAIGALLVPPALLKTASTGWRMVRYYTGNAAYSEAGPPPMLLRLLGPVVVLSTLGLLASGIVLVVIGQQTSHRVLLTVAGFRVDAVTLHQGTFVVWGASTGLHLLGRVLPAWDIAFRPPGPASIPGTLARVAAMGMILVVAATVAVVLTRIDGSWHTLPFFAHDRRLPPALR
jgi:hypothetical protein